MIINTLSGGGRLQEKSVTPTTDTIIVTPDDGYYGLSKVTVYPTSGYTTTLTVRSSTTTQTFEPSSPDETYAKVIVEPNLLQTKSITPSTSSQTVSPDTGYYGLSSVTVGASPVKTTYATVSMTSNNRGFVLTCNDVITKLVRATYLCVGDGLTDSFPANVCLGFHLYPMNNYYNMITYKSYDASTDGYFTNVAEMRHSTNDGTLKITGEGTNTITLTPSGTTLGAMSIYGAITVCAINYV